MVIDLTSLAFTFARVIWFGGKGNCCLITTFLGVYIPIKSILFPSVDNVLSFNRDEDLTRERWHCVYPLCTGLVMAIDLAASYC